MKETETKTQKKPQSKAAKVIKAILNTIINIMIVCVLIISIVVAVLAITSKNSSNGLPNVFGYTLQYVQTNSMSTPSPDGYEGGCFTDEDVIIGRVYDIDNPIEFNVGDIITFKSKENDEDGNPRMITHRIVDKADVTSSYHTYQTWGDNREVAELPDQKEEKDYIGDVDIVAYNYTADYHGAVLKGLAGFMRTLRSQAGFFGFILLPMIIFFIYAIIRVVISSMNYRKSKEEESKEDAEKEKEEAVKAAVAAALAEKGASAAPESSGMSDEELEQFRQFQEFQKMQNAAKEADKDSAATADTEE